MNEEEKKAMKYFYNLRATIDESNMLFDEDINVKCGKETIKNITTVFNIIEKKDKIIKYNKEESDKAFIHQNKIIRSMAEFMFHNYYGMTYVDEWQFEEKIQEIIGDFERKIEQ